MDNETDLSIRRSIIYASERKGIYTETNGLVEVHFAKDYRFSDFKRNAEKSLRNRNGKQDGTGSFGETQEQRRDTALTDKLQFVPDI